MLYYSAGQQEPITSNGIPIIRFFLRWNKNENDIYIYLSNVSVIWIHNYASFWMSTRSILIEHLICVSLHSIPSFMQSICITLFNFSHIYDGNIYMRCCREKPRDPTRSRIGWDIVLPKRRWWWDHCPHPYSRFSLFPQTITRQATVEEMSFKLVVNKGHSAREHHTILSLNMVCI